MNAKDSPSQPNVEDRLALLETLLDRVPDFFYVHNAELRFQYVNRAAAEYFGHTKNSIVGLRHRDVDENPEQARFYEQTLIPIIERGEPVTTDDLPYKRHDGSTGLLRAHIVPFDNPKTGEPMMLGISHDVTNDRQIAEERARRAVYERELDIARRVQQSLLPATLPEIEGFRVSARCEPAAFVGGDFYDFIPTNDNRVVAVLGDVTGHGVGSALIAAVCRSFARVLFAHQPFGEAIHRLDRMMHADLQVGSFVTLGAVEIHSEQRSVRFLSAGHGPVIVARREGSVDTLPTHTTPLGLGLTDTVIEATPIDLSAGDSLLVPSDGLFESRSSDGEQFGVARLATSAMTGQTVEASIDACFRDEAQWRMGLPAEDDRTLIVIHA